jgi:hypothetical protein
MQGSGARGGWLFDQDWARVDPFQHGCDAAGTFVRDFDVASARAIHAAFNNPFTK